MRFRPIHVTRLKHALEAHHAMLLVELRALRKIGNAIDLFDLE
jgi:hypothetical protein